MSEIKVVLAQNQDDPMEVLKNSLSKSGLQVAVCSSGFDALDELINSGGHILVLADQLPDISGFQLSCLLKSTSITHPLPVVLVSSGNDSNDNFWKRASMADSVLKRRQVEQNETDSVKLIKRLAEGNGAVTAITPDKIDNQSVISGEFAGSDLIKSYGELLNGLLAERLVRHFTRTLASTTNDRAEFTTLFFDMVSRLFMPDVSAIIVNSPTGPWSVFHTSKSINKEMLETIVGNAATNLGLTQPVQASFFGEPLAERGVQLKKAKVLEIPGADGTKLGAVLVGWSSDKDIDSVLKTALEHLKDQLEPVLRLLISEDRYQNMQAQAQYWSMVDQITGLYNMEFFIGFLQQQLLFSMRQKLPVGLCIIDVDGFVGLNAQYGAETGNLLLKTLAERLSKCIRSSDLIARYSGDQFVVVLPNTELDGVKILGEKLRTEAEKLNPESEQAGRSQRVTISVGCATFDFKSSAPEGILKDAKDALLRAKEKGRNCVSD